MEERALFCQILLGAASDYRTLISFGLFLDYGPKFVEPWYISSSSTLLSVLSNKALILSHVWYGLHGFCYYSDLVPQTQTNTHTTRRDQYTYTHINIYWHHLVCAYRSCLYYIEWTIFWYKHLLCRGPQCLYCSKITHL